MKIKNKKILVISIVLLGIITGIKLYKNYTYYENNKTLNIIKNKISYYDDNDALIAYTIDGEKVSFFPPKGNYDVTVDCKDTATGTWDNDKWGLYISNATSEKVKCNISFEKQSSTNLADYITTLASTDTVNLAYDGTSDNNLRYIGADPSNYLCFDTTCSTGKWRVIGVMNNMQTESNGTQNLVKIVRASAIYYLQWNSSSTNDWTTSSLNTQLNSGDLYKKYIETYDNFFETVTWGVGGYSSSDITASKFYSYEREATWTGKIALMYPSDYGYATSGGSTTNRDMCLSLNINSSYWGNSSYSDCKNNDYLFYSNHWFLFPDSSSSRYVFYLTSSGSLDNDKVYAYASIFPSGYLVSNVTFIAGDGSSSNPWILSDASPDVVEDYEYGYDPDCIVPNSNYCMYTGDLIGSPDIPDVDTPDGPTLSGGVGDVDDDCVYQDGELIC
jgi:hypothetical protein